MSVAIPVTSQRWVTSLRGQPILAIKRAEYREFMGEVGEQDWRWYLHQA